MERLFQWTQSALTGYWAEIVAAVFGVFAVWFRDRIIKFIRLSWDAVALLIRVRKAIKCESPWLVKPPRPLEKLGKSRIPILSIANLKGGVGKTTIAANLSGYFSSEATSVRDATRRCRVLAIDLDFQGSLSSVLLKYDDRVPPRATYDMFFAIFCSAFRRCPQRVVFTAGRQPDGV